MPSRLMSELSVFMCQGSRGWMRDAGCGMPDGWMFDVGCSMFDVRCSMFDVGCSMLGVWMPGVGGLTYDLRFTHHPSQLLHVYAPAACPKNDRFATAVDRTFEMIV